MGIITIEAQTRELGKKGARATRRAGRVPCVLYGHSTRNVHFSMDELALHRLVFTDELHRLRVDLDGESYDCILKDVEMDPVRNEPTHADFQALVAGEVIELDVPISFEGTPVGKTNGGDVQYIIHELTVSCLPADIPDSLEVNVEHLDIGDTIHVSDLAFDKIEIVTPGKQTVIAVTVKRIVEEPEEEEAELLLEGEEGEEGEATSDSEEDTGREADES